MNKTAIVTTTMYNPKDENSAFRIDFARKTISEAVKSGYDIIIADGSSSYPLKEEFRQLGAEVLVQEKGMGKSRRQVIKRACETGHEIIAWIEPEKYSLVPEIEKTTLPIEKKQADLVIPKRKSLDSYPDFQQCAEKFGNHFWKSLTGHDLDVWFGPKTFSSDAAEYFLKYDGEKLGYGDLWDSINLPVIEMIRNQMKIIGVKVDFNYPEEQTKFEQGNLFFYQKRLEQLNNLIFALEDYWKNY